MALSDYYGTINALKTIPEDDKNLGDKSVSLDSNISNSGEFDNYEIVFKTSFDKGSDTVSDFLPGSEGSFFKDYQTVFGPYVDFCSEEIGGIKNIPNTVTKYEKI